MKKMWLFIPKLTFALFAAIIFSGCFKDKITKTYTILKPVYKEKAEVLANIKSNSPEQLQTPGKIYLYGRYIFLNEVNKGVHIIDNINPSNPIKVAFINIPGNIDIAVKGNTLFADLYTDLIAIDITDPLNARFTKLVPNIFPERNYGNGFIADGTRIIVDWIKKDTTVEVTSQGGGWDWGGPRFMLLAAGAFTNQSGASAPGIGGSMARFAVVNNYLYTVNMSSLGVLDINNAADPVKISTTAVGWNIETIYPFKEKLFIGSATGMFIYDISNPAAPVRQGQFTHVRACDPVVADDNYAYVTLRTGNFCVGVINQLDVINVQNVFSPSLVKTYPMTNPHGLSKDGDLLFVCDGKDGLKVYNVADAANLRLIKHIKGIETYDAIAWNKKLLVVATNGLYQYDYTDVSNMRLLSKMVINR